MAMFARFFVFLYFARSVISYEPTLFSFLAILFTANEYSSCCYRIHKFKNKQVLNDVTDLNGI